MKPHQRTFDRILEAVLPEFRERSLADLRDAIDREFFLLSEAHYERYIAPGFIREAFGPPLIARDRKSVV